MIDELEFAPFTDGKQNVHPASIHTSRDSGRLQKIEGDLLDSPCTYIVHQCNCKTTYAKGLAKSLFDKFPHANCYDGEAKTTRRPGKQERRDMECCACMAIFVMIVNFHNFHLFIIQCFYSSNRCRGYSDLCEWTTNNRKLVRAR